MTTYNQLLGEPVDILHPTVRVHAVDDNEGLPIRQITISLTPGEGTLELPRGREGQKGDKGDPANPYQLRGDQTTAEIAALALGEGEAGWAYRNSQTNALHYWTGNSWVVLANAFGAQGPQGPPGDIVNVSIKMVDKGDPAHAYLSGPEGAQSLNLEIPSTPGPQGPTGPSAAISSAADYDNSVAPKTGQIITRKANGKWGPGSAPYTRFYSVPEGAFTDTGDVSNGTRTQVAQYPLEALDFDSFVVVSGHIQLGQAPIAQAEIEVRLGSPTGTLIGKGFTDAGQGNRFVSIVAHYSSDSAPSANTTPGAPLGIIPAAHTGNAGTLYVILTRKSGLQTVRAFSSGAQLLIHRYPKVQ